MANCGTKQWLGNQEAFSGDYHIISAYALQGSMIGRADKNGPQGDGVNEDVSFTLNTTDRHVEGVGTLKASGGDLGGGSETLACSYAVRRLTPTECERLQGFPDNWTDIPGASDTGRYKALGNSVAVPCVEWIMGQIAEKR